MNVAPSTPVLQEDPLIRMAVAPSHWVGPHQMRPSVWISAIKASVVGPSDEHLVQDHLVQATGTVDVGQRPAAGQ